MKAGNDSTARTAAGSEAAPTEPGTSPRFPGAALRAIRRGLGLNQASLCAILRIGPASLARYELRDAPAWMRHALIGVGVLEGGVPVDEMIRRVTVEEHTARERRS